MAESKFLKFQDKNGDKFIDICEDKVEVKDQFQCPPCTPNPYAALPNWKELGSDEPFFNQRECKYQVAVATSYTTTMDPALLEAGSLTEEAAEAGTNAVFDEFLEEAVESLLVNNSKDDSDPSKSIIRQAIEYSDYDLDPRPTSRLNLLYSINYEILQTIEEADDDTEEEEEADPDTTPGPTVTYQADEIKQKLQRVRKSLKLYMRYLKVFRAIKGGNVLKTKDNSVFNLQNYGDSGTFGGSTLGSILTNLDNFLNKKKLNLVGTGGPAFFKEKVTKLEFTFSGKYKLTKLRVWSAGCGDIPKAFGKKKLKSLNSKDVFRDPTAMAYFSQLSEMDTALMAREPMPWLEFLKEFTYPEVYDTFPQKKIKTSATSCVADALEKEGKQLGQDLLDSTFSIGDALAFAFRKNVCLNEIGEIEKEDFKLGINASRVTLPDNDTIFGMATEQAFATMEQDDISFDSLCAGILSQFTGPSVGTFSLEDLWKESLDKLKLCGLSDLILESMACLIKGLTLEEAIGKIIESAIKGMSLENLQDFFLNVLPTDKQREISQLVDQKLSQGDIFKNSSLADEFSTAVAAGAAPSAPFGDNQKINDQKENHMIEGNQDAMVPLQDSSRPYENPKQPQYRTLASQLDASSGSGSKLFNDTLIIGVYANALIEVFSDDLLDIVDKLNKYPGGQIIASTLAMLDCPQTPLMDPSIPTFIKSIELPYCNTPFSFTAPKFANPFGWIPEVKDFPKIIFSLFRQALTQLIIKLIVQLMLKICNLISGSVCKGLETVGDLAASSDTISAGKTSFKNAIRSTICGSDANEEQLNDTIEDLFKSLGLGAAALADQERVNNFMSDLSSATTQAELMAAFMGTPSIQLLTIVDNLIEYEYTEFREGLPNQNSAADFFKNIGNLFPAAVKDAINNELNNLPPDNFMPANPSLCATPDQVEDFCQRRQALLGDRATAEQAVQMCENSRQGILDELGDLGDLLQSGLPSYLDNNMPPLVSDPGCDNGLVPFEAEEAQLASIKSAANELKRLKMAYATDMLGNGPGESRWGLINMIMSDTMGNPLTAHHRKEFFQPGYVDFYSDTSLTDLSFEELMSGKFVPTVVQRGAYPAKVAEWLQYQLAGSSLPDGTGVTDLSESLIFSSNNDWQTPITSSANFEELGLTGGLYGKPEIKLYELPDLGYNVANRVDIENKKIKFIRRGRKATPDVTLIFRDNAKGLRLGVNSKDSSYSYGFDIEVYLSEMQNSIPANESLLNKSLSLDEEETIPNSGRAIHNIFSDNVRILITNKNNPGAKYESPLAPISPIELPAIGDDNNEEPEISERYYEFFAEDNTLSTLDTSNYSKFLECFINQKNYIPQVVLLKEIIENNGGSLSNDEIKGAHDEIMTSLMSIFASEISNNEPSFSFGAEFDILSEDDTEYVLGAGYRDSGLLYGEAEIEGEDEDGNAIYRKIRNDDMIMGTSKMQYQIEEEGREGENRIFYLDPAKFGGTFMNPPVYIVPIQNQGWMGLIDVLFPELTHCKTGKKDLVNFAEIEELIGDRRRNIPIDERLKAGDSDCVLELPYNKILTRDSAATLEGIITSAIRIFITTHVVKSLATFTKFKIDFPNVFSDIYAQYIVESMEQVLSGADSDAEERLSLFKDSEFWFAFLEQAAQMYGRRVDEGYIIDPPQNVLTALFKLNDLQQSYNYPSKEALKILKDLGDVKRTKTLKNYREEQNLNAIYNSKDLAKVVLKQLIVEELNLMAPRLIQNMESIGMSPDILDLSYYLFEELAQGSELDLSVENMIETSEDLPTEGGLEDQYTSGGEFSIYEVREEDSENSVGDEYIGYYHTNIDEEGNLLYMAGPVHVEIPHDLLKPFATKVVVPIGSVPEYGYGYSDDNSKPFLIEKYIKIDNAIYSPSSAIDIILANDSNLNISDVYPGTMEEVFDARTNAVVGVTGELGVRYGLLFSTIINGEKAVITKVEIDALDTIISEFAPLENNSKLLLCLLNILKEDNTFNIVQRYIFPLNKITSILAIYNDMAFLPSIGQVTVEDNLAYGKDAEFSVKPGRGADVETDDDGNVSITESSVEGWASLADRSLSLQTSVFFTHWDEWSQALLTRSKIKLKRMFKRNYNYRNFKPGEFGLDFPKPGNIFLNNLRGQLKPPTGKKLLPWWKRRKLRTNPFDAKGNICEKE